MLSGDGKAAVGTLPSSLSAPVKPWLMGVLVNFVSDYGRTSANKTNTVPDVPIKASNRGIACFGGALSFASGITIRRWLVVEQFMGRLCILEMKRENGLFPPSSDARSAIIGNWIKARFFTRPRISRNGN